MVPHTRLQIIIIIVVVLLHSVTVIRTRICTRGIYTRLEPYISIDYRKSPLDGNGHASDCKAGIYILAFYTGDGGENSICVRAYRTPITKSQLQITRART